MIWPHDDTQSLIAFYGKPWEDTSLLTHVVPPFIMKYEGTQIHGILIHVNCAEALDEALNDIWDHYGHDQNQIDAVGLSNYSGSYAYRNVRGGASLSCHAFGAALDIDADHNQMYYNPNVVPCRMPQPAVFAFENTGATWGGRFTHRVDKMHYQWAHE